MPKDITGLTPEEITAYIEEIESEKTEAARVAAELKQERARLLENKERIVTENKKLKKVKDVLQRFEIDPKDEDFDDKIELLTIQERQAEARTDSTTKREDKGTKEMINPEISQQISRMQTQIENLNTALATAEKEKADKDRKYLETVKKNKALKLLGDMGCERPEHVFLLTQDKYKLEGEELIGGDEYDPVPIDTVFGNLRSSEEFGIYFRGSGKTGTGLQPNSQAAHASMNNPFRSDNFNGTEVGRIIKENPQKAHRLLQEARAAGKLEPALEKLELPG
jgi:hypothetical protein